MKKILLAILIGLTTPAIAVSPECYEHATPAEGKAYWFSYYMAGKKVYITRVYNNDCNHCSNEISTAFKKWLVMNDYDPNASTVFITNVHDVSESDLNERREEVIYKRKQQGCSIVNVSFSYTDN